MTEPPSLNGWASTPPSAGLGPDLHQDRAVRTRALVLKCAAELFAERGYHRTAINDVAARVGMTKGAVYFHFPSKDVLAVAVVEEHYTRWPALLADVRTKGLSPLDTLIAMLEGASRMFAADIIVQAGARLQLERYQCNLPLPTPYVGWISLLTQLLDEAKQAGQLREGVDPAATARSIVAAFFGVQHISYTLQGRADLMERWQETWDLLLFAIRAPAQDAPSGTTRDGDRPTASPET